MSFRDTTQQTNFGTSRFVSSIDVELLMCIHLFSSDLLPFGIEGRIRKYRVVKKSFESLKDRARIGSHESEDSTPGRERDTGLDNPYVGRLEVEQFSREVNTKPRRLTPTEEAMASH